jgi:hypothetical protein
MDSGQQNHFQPMTDSSPPTPAPTALEIHILNQLQAVGGACPTLTALPIILKGSARQRNLACQRLGDRGWLTYDLDITQFGLTLTGKTLLSLDLSVWPVTPDERLILRSCLGGRIGPGQVHHRVPVGDRQRLLAGLVEQKLIVGYRSAIVRLCLTPQGNEILLFQSDSILSRQQMI